MESGLRNIINILFKYLGEQTYEKVMGCAQDHAPHMKIKINEYHAKTLRKTAEDVSDKLDFKACQ